MKIAFSVGRVVYGLPFIVFGIRHLVADEKTLQYMTETFVPSYVPGGVFWVYATGVVMLVAGIALVANRFVFPAAAALAVTLLVFVLTIHAPNFYGALTGEDGSFKAALGGSGNLLKDTALLGGALILAAKYCRCAECSTGAELEHRSETGYAETEQTPV